MEGHRRTVVGADGSDRSEIALKWAAGEAECRGATLVIVTTWTAPPPTIVYPYAGRPDRDPGDPREAAMNALGEIVRTVLEGQAQPLGRTAGCSGRYGEDTDRAVPSCRPGGRRYTGTGGISDWLLGSVSHKVAQHARCSVAVVRWQRQPACVRACCRGTAQGGRHAVKRTEQREVRTSCTGWF